MTLDGRLEHRDGAWVLTLVRDFTHPREKVWPWLIEPDRLRRWSPVVPDRAFDTVGPRQVRENPQDAAMTGDVLSVDPPRELVHRWGEDVVRWLLEPTATGCRLTLEQRMAERDSGPMNAAGWHICLDVLDAGLAGDGTSRAVGQDAMARGWAALRDRYRQALSP
jgi:uncharacterized protein YndB with AHSA1/START domain